MTERDFVRGTQGLGLSVSRETLGRLANLAELLGRWQKAINLVSPASFKDVWVRHFLDSAQLVPLIPDRAKSLADLGSGAGFPGLVLAATRPDLSVTLVESDARKGAFLGEAARRLALPVAPRIVIGRIEAVPPLGADVVTARALAPLDQLLTWAERHRAEQGIFIFHKGARWRDELADAVVKRDVAYEPFSSVTDRDAVILRIGPQSAADHRDRQPEGRRR